MSRHILVVDDDRDILDFLQAVLQEADCQVSCAADVRQALARLDENQPPVDLILSDVRMPEVDGMQLLSRLASTHPRLPVVLMTAHADLGMSLDAIRAGATDMVLKPITEHEIERILSRLSMVESRSFVAGDMSDPLFVETLSIRMPSQRPLVHKSVRRIHQHFASGLAHLGISAAQIRVCLVEAMENALIHGNLGIDSRLKEQDWGAFENCVSDRQRDPVLGRKLIAVQARLSAEAFHVEVQDQGEGFDPGAAASACEDASGLLASGRGVQLIRSIMDEVTWQDGGRRIIMRKQALRQAGDARSDNTAPHPAVPKPEPGSGAG